MHGIGGFLNKNSGANSRIESLESRRLMSATTIPPEPLVPIFTNEPVMEFAGVSQTVRVAYLPTISVGHLSQLHGTLNWGDGSSSAAGFERDKNGGIDIVGTHLYVKPGTFAVTSSLITETPFATGGANPTYIIELGTVNTTATVSPAPPQLTEKAGKSFTATLGKFHYFTLDVIFSAKINWGDGITTTGTLTGGDLSQGNWQLHGTHDYARAGTYLVNAEVYSQVAGSKLKPSPTQSFAVVVHVIASSTSAG